MAEGILTDAVGRILEMLASRGFQEIQLACAVKDEILKLKNTVEIINDVLEDAEEQFNNEKNHSIFRRLKDAVYDADDLLDEFYTQLRLKEVMSGNRMTKEVRIFFSESNQIAYSFKMGDKIKTIRKRLDDIKNDQQFHLFKHDQEKRVNYYPRKRETHSFVREENVIGREDDKNKILQLLFDSNDHGENNVSVISIVGIGGIGKTTIAQSIYNADKVKTHFQLRMWVGVSDDFTVRTVAEKILKSTDSKKKNEQLEMDGLQEELRKQIDGKKYLLVLDDVWNKNREKWNELHTLLKDGAKGSKILVTTRMREVVNIMSRLPLIHDLRGLTEEKSWSLFAKIVFEQGEEFKDPSLKKIGENIVAKCVGVPLAIRTVGNLLYGKEKEFWVSFRDKELSKISQEENDILPILKLSYYHLSPQLKQCFAYCALLPKDYEFEKEKLIQLWMAQGFLDTSKKNPYLEDVGNECFMDLLSGSFLQDLKGEGSGPGRVITCKMHDLMHDLAQFVVGSECQMVTNDTDSVDERSRHISFAPDLKSSNKSIAELKANRLRTLLSFCSFGELNKSHFNKILSNFRCLRTLKLSELGIEEVPTSIGKLKLLRYLDLSGNNDIKELPNSVSKLKNLQTLNLADCGSLKNLPGDMRKMVSLQYLMSNGCNSLASMPRGLGELTSLRTLSLFVVGKRDRLYNPLRELSRLDKLRGGLTIKLLEVKENVNMEEANLEKKQYLESIRLEGHGNYGDDEVMVDGLKLHPNVKELSIEGLKSVMFSDPCISSFTNLTRIEISRSCSCRSITPLDQLPSLRFLSFLFLENLEYISESVRVSNSTTSTPAASTTTFFPSLKELEMIGCSKLKGWRKINDGEDDQVTITEKAQLLSFPRLSKLRIWD